MCRGGWVGGCLGGIRGGGYMGMWERVCGRVEGWKGGTVDGQKHAGIVPARSFDIFQDLPHLER